MSFSKMISQPRMFLHQHPRRKSLKQLESQTNTHRRGHFNKQVDMINTNVKLINFEPFSVSHLPQEEFAIHSKPVKFERVFGIFNFPHKVECVLSEAVLPRFQIHFLSPKSAGDKAHANLMVYFEEPSIQALPNSQTKEINLLEDGDSSLL